uniref:ATP synthase F0 subunit 8 n=1 Tax=Blattisocius keegani TaxID=2337216 RepID=A0A4Y5QEI2_9ACAR|nr:ATP synthase F0 subunit 8 [Blattisocius keegani]
MPQMSPMNWSLILMMLTLTLILNLMSIYFKINYFMMKKKFTQKKMMKILW